MLKYTHLTLEERNSIYFLQNQGLNKKEIAKQINRSPSTITRELRRNKSRVRYSHDKYPKYEYLPDSAENIKTERRIKANYRTPLKNEIVKDFVFSKLKENWSPDIISGILRKNALEKISKIPNIENKNILQKQIRKHTISHETIYKFIYSKEGEKEGLKNFLRRKHKTRRKYSGRKTQKLPKIPNITSISERKNIFPKSETRKEFGHFEGDSILSVRSTFSAIHTEVERKTRFIFARKINKKTKENTEIAMIDIFSNIDKAINKNQIIKNNQIIKSTTLDNGLEFANHQNITNKIKENNNINLKIFFAEPYKSWQRGTNEHANGMIRRFYPKGTNFDKITNEELQEVINYLNNRPRKILNYKTSQEAWIEEIEKLEKTK